MALEIKKENFEEIISSDKLVVIDFWAEWCGPCRTIAPIVGELAEEFEGQALIGKCNVEDNDDITMKKGGEVVDKQIGACSKEDLAAKIKAHL